MKGIYITLINRYKIILPILIILAFFTLNLFTPMIADDFSYAFVFGTGERVSSISDVFISQYNHYFTWGGRSVAHFLFQFFLNITGKFYFNICNTMIYTLFIFLIYFHITGSLKKINCLLFCTINIVLWFIVPAWGQNFLLFGGSCNYLWTTTIILFFLVPYRKKNDNNLFKLNILSSVLFLLLGILAGWSNENSGAAVLFLLIAYFIKKIIIKEKKSFFEISGFIGFLIGYALLIIAPGNYARLALSLAEEPVHNIFIIEIIKRLLKTTDMFFKSNAFILAGFSVFLLIDSIFHRRIKINYFVLFYFIAGLAGMYSLILISAISERTCFIVIVFFLIASLNLLFQIKITVPEIIKRNLPVLAIIFLLFFGWSFIIASKNVFGIYQKWEKRSQYIITQKENGNTNITVKAPIPAPDKHTALFGMVDLLPDSEIWPNTDIAKYYGIELITGEENKEPW